MKCIECTEHERYLLVISAVFPRALALVHLFVCLFVFLFHYDLTRMQGRDYQRRDTPTTNHSLMKGNVQAAGGQITQNLRWMAEREKRRAAGSKMPVKRLGRDSQP